MRSFLFALGLASILVPACGGDDGPSDSGARRKVYGGDRPADLKTPATLTPGKQYPLLVVLHGYGANGFVQTAFFGVAGLPGADEALLIAPDGTLDSTGKQFWNADAACCDFENRHPDDVAYIGGIIDDISAEWPVDRNQIYVLGHSNGGFMAYRMACERADVIAAIGSLAGDASSNPSACNPTRKVNVLHMHGTMDDSVAFSGAMQSVDEWAQKNGCGATATAGMTYDFDNNVAGSETHATVRDGCPADGQIELWTMQGSTHIPVLNGSFATTAFAWFQAHKR
jgi:polyhydroxybutyrate depolymerase